MTVVLYAVEGGTDVPYAEKLITSIGRIPRVINASGGSATIDQRLRRWTQSSNHAPMLVLRDWDEVDNVVCPPALRTRLANASCPNNVALRIVVRSMESWLMADRAAAVSFFRTRHIPDDPEALSRPKIALVDACRKSTSSAIRSGMVPSGGSGSAVGIEFTRLVAEFGALHWNPERARSNSSSLDRTMIRLDQLAADGIW